MDNNKQNNKVNNENKTKDTKRDSQAKGIKSATLIQNPFKNEK
ncbi:MAG: hypothetical protein AB9836_10290 [Aminipila sp.]